VSPGSDSAGDVGLDSRRPVGAGGSAAPGGQATLDAVPTGGLYLVDEELAEHQRWAVAGTSVGTAGSEQRTDFIADTAGAASIQGMLTGLGMGLGMAGVGLGLDAVIPGLGFVLGGVMSASDLITNADKYGKEIAGFGTGSDDYEILANDLQAVAAVLQIVTDVIGILAGIAGGIAVVAWVLTVASLGAFSPVAAAATAVAFALGIAGAAVGAVNSLVIQPLIVLFRSLHAFTSQADPRDVQASGGQIASAAGAWGAGIGGIAAMAAGAAGGGEQMGEGPVVDDVVPTQNPSAGGEVPPAVVAEPSAGGGAPVSEPPAGGGPPVGGPPGGEGTEIIPAPIVVPPEPSPPTLPGGFAGPDIPGEVNPFGDTRPMPAVEQVNDQGTISPSDLDKVTVPSPSPEEPIPDTEPGPGHSPPNAPESGPPSPESGAGGGAGGASGAAGGPSDGPPPQPGEVPPGWRSDYLYQVDLPRDSQTTPGNWQTDFPSEPNIEQFHVYEPQGNENPAQINYHDKMVVKAFQVTDPATGQVRWAGPTQVNGEPVPINPNTGEPYAINLRTHGPDPNAVDPATGQPYFSHDNATSAVELRGNAPPGQQKYDPTTGQWGPRTAPGAHIPAGDDYPPGSRVVDPANPRSLPPDWDEAVHQAIYGQGGGGDHGPGGGGPGRGSQGPGGGGPGPTGGGIPPAAGLDTQTVTENVNPDYQPPPGTKAQLDQAQLDIKNILAKRAEQDSLAARNRDAEATANSQGASLSAAIDRTDQGKASVTAHQSAVDAKTAANKEQQDKQGQAKSQLEQYSDRKAGIEAVKGPLTGWQAATGAVMGASWLPEDVAAKLQKMNSDAANLNAQLTKADAKLVQQIAAQPQLAGQLAADQGAIQTARQQGAQADAAIDQGRQQLAATAASNDQTGAKAAQEATAAEGRSAALQAAAEQRRQEHDTLAAQLLKWAEEHKAARLEALQETQSKMESSGYKIKEVRGA
jgi:hypothetical protein